MKKSIILLLLCLTLLSGCGGGEAFRARYDLLGTGIHITAYGWGAGEAADKAMRRVEEIHADMSAMLPGNGVDALNHADGQWVALPADTLALLARAKDYAALSGGAFDVTIAPLVNLWGIGTDHAAVPSKEAIAALLPLVGADGLELEGEKARLIKSGAMIDLGGIAKGYACEESVRILRENGSRRAVLDFGGNVFVLGEKSPGAGWRVGVRHPVIGEAGILGTLTLSNQAVVTSGGYERFFEEDGQLYHHILNPATGYPADSGLLSVTIVCTDATEADALSTACFVLGEEAGLALINSLPDVEALFVAEDRGVAVTEGLRESFALTDTSFFLREDKA
jgi:thiamine biosynthesis lipoprotein